jgi:hypothetical protein
MLRKPFGTVPAGFLLLCKMGEIFWYRAVRTIYLIYSALRKYIGSVLHVVKREIPMR